MYALEDTQCHIFGVSEIKTFVCQVPLLFLAFYFMATNQNLPSREMRLISKDEFLTADESRATYALRFPKSELRNNASEDRTRTVRNEKSGIRRKHHRLWTLPEVMKLIEGVSHYGVGRWTDIKRLLFATSAFRTSVDLKVLMNQSYDQFFLMKSFLLIKRKSLLILELLHFTG